MNPTIKRILADNPAFADAAKAGQPFALSYLADLAVKAAGNDVANRLTVARELYTFLSMERVRHALTLEGDAREAELEAVIAGAQEMGASIAQACLQVRKAEDFQQLQHAGEFSQGGVSASAPSPVNVTTGYTPTTPTQNQ